MIILGSFFLFHKNIHYGYSLEVPHRGTSNEYHNICFNGELEIQKRSQNTLCHCEVWSKLMLYQSIITYSQFLTRT